MKYNFTKKVFNFFFKLTSIIFPILMILLSILYFLSPINPISWEPSANPGFINKLSINSDLKEIKQLLNGVGVGGEDIVKGPDGHYFTAYRDGRIIRFDLDGNYKEFANSYGKPLGMEFDANGNLIVADAEKGLLSINSDGSIKVLVDSVNGIKMLFVDDLDIANDGTIWFSDASLLYSYDNSIYSLLENKATGRLLSYSPLTKETVVHLTNLHFANGVTLGPNNSYVLVNETGGAKIKRLWLSGPKQGKTDYLIEGLPGYPDNLSFNGEDIFWVAFAGIRQPVIDALADKPFVRKLIGGLPRSMLVPKNTHGLILGINLSGEVVRNLQDLNSPIDTLTSVNQWDNQLLIGNLNSDFIAILDLK